MFRLLISVLMFTIFCPITFGQDPDEFNKNEFFGGYMFQESFDDPLHGFEVSYTRNINRYVGLKGDVSSTFRSDSVTIPTEDSSSAIIRNKNSLFNFLGGVQIKDNASKKRIKPFGHAMVGLGHVRNRITLRCSGSCPPSTESLDETLSANGFAGAFGGGLDIKLTKKIDLRAIQADYNPTFSGGRVINSYRFSIGIVIK